MDSAFIEIVKKLVAEQGKAALFDPFKGKALLGDYTCGEYKKESRLLLKALNADVPKVIDSAQDLSTCKLQQIQILQDDYDLDKAKATEVVYMLALVLRGDRGPQSAEEYVIQGDIFKAQEEYGMAIGAYTEAIRLEPKAANVFNSRGFVYFIQGDRDKARADYQEALRLDPQLSQAKERLKGLQKKGLFTQKAAGLATPTAAPVPASTAEELYERGKEFYNAKDYDKAIAYLSEAIRLRPYFFDALWIRSYSYRDKFDYNKAIDDCTQVIRCRPSADAYRSRAQVYEKKGDYDQAITDWTQVLCLDPQNLNARSELDRLKAHKTRQIIEG